jgi:VPDSG-CTERM motif
LANSTVVAGQTPNFLQATGTGTITNGTDSSSGLWTFTATDALGGAACNSVFTFTSSTAAVPDGGTTMSLLGLSLLGLYGVRSKFGQH